MVRSVKRCLKKTLGNSRVNFEEFETLLIEVEGILNSRPLTNLSEELGEPLTPSSLCIGRRVLSPVAEIKTSVACNSPSELKRKQKHLKTVLEHFWNPWCREYLRELREHHRGKKTSEARVMKKGDVVCVYEDSVPRQKWKIGVVQQLIPGRDGHVRAAVVRLVKGDRSVEINRSVEILYHVEVPEVRAENLNARDGKNAPTIMFVSDDQVQIVQGDRTDNN